MGCLRICVEREDVLLAEMGVSDINISGNGRVENLVRVGLPEDPKRRLGIDRLVTHGEEKPRELELGIEVGTNFLNRLTNLDNRIELEIARRDNDEDLV